MANNSDGSAVYEVKVGEDDYIDGLDVTESDGSITTYLFRPANYDEVEAARKRAESAASLASSAAGTAKTQAYDANVAAGAARTAAAKCSTATENANAAVQKANAANDTASASTALASNAAAAANGAASHAEAAANQARRSRTRWRRAPAANPISRSCAVRTASSRRCSPTRRGSSSTWTGPSTARHPRRRCPATRCRSAARARSRAAR